ncbi:major capsid protein [Leptolyngbya ohadii]|uniref:major capsid protein n=1 Tax=Leptolyngbya ohadii TaxID=1962290 RepID=UPI000B59F4E1|nr:major capsid protein [Leptolyngbya ohadii]
MKTFYELYEELQEDRYFERLALNPQAQFGSEDQPLLGASLLPERLVEQNSFEETQVRYRTQPALDNNRYSPTQKQASGHLVGSFRVDLGHTDTQKEFTGKDHDDLIKLLERDSDMEATMRVIRWSDNELVRPHVFKNEIQRWQALLKAQVIRRTSDGAMEPIDYYRPADHYVEVPGGTAATPAGWYSNNYDPFDDIEAGVEKLEGKGYQVTGMYSTGYLARVLRRNAKVIGRSTSISVNADGQITSTTNRVSNSVLDEIMLDEAYPTITRYNGGYESATGFKRYMELDTDGDYLLLVGSTQRQYDLATDYVGTSAADVGEFADGAIVLPNTLGYYGVGRNVGESNPGRTITTWMQDKKPKGMGGESYQAGLPVIAEPQAYYVIKVKRPTP